MTSTASTRDRSGARASAARSKIAAKWCVLNSKKSRDAKAKTGDATAPGTVAANTDAGNYAPEPLVVRHPRGELAALAWGPPDGLPLLAVHGWMDNAASFAKLAPLLRKHRLVAMDLPGHGHSSHRGSAFYHLTDYVPDVLAMADALSWTTFDLLGHSLGAGIATLVAGAFPQRIRRLALIEGLGPLTSDPRNMPVRLREAWEKSAVLAGKAPSSYAHFEAAVTARATAGIPVSDEAASLLCERGLRKAGGRWVWRHDPRLTLPSPQRLTESQVLAFIRAISAPMLVVRAEQGLPFDKQMFMARLEAVQDLRLERIAGGHHLHMEEGAVAVAEAIRSHLAPEDPD